MSDQPVAEAATYTTQRTQEKIIHAVTGIRTRDPNNRGDVVLDLRMHGHRDRYQIIPGSNLN